MTGVRALEMLRPSITSSNPGAERHAAINRRPNCASDAWHYTSETLPSPETRRPRGAPDDHAAHG